MLYLPFPPKLMNSAQLLSSLPGPFHFLQQTEEELARVWPGGAPEIPEPQRIFLHREEATPILGFPILVSDGLRQLAHALHGWVAQSERGQLAILHRERLDGDRQEESWDRYAKLLTTAIENVTLSAHGRPFPAVFWLHHSLFLARLLKETPRRFSRLDPDLERAAADAAKYRILQRYLDRAVSLTYDVASRCSQVLGVSEQELFPSILHRMRDNVLIFTEDRIGRHLGELGSYFQGVLGADVRELRRRLEHFDDWHEELIDEDPFFRALVTHLVGGEDYSAYRDLRMRAGYLELASRHSSYAASSLPDAGDRKVWEKLLAKLKEFELLNSLRRLVAPVVRDGEEYVGHDRTVTLPSGEPLRLSASTRPLDFLSPWVVDPTVERFGMIYDITDFTRVVSELHRSTSHRQDRSFLRMVSFQRRVNRLAAEHRVQLEKYLGDGAFYSCRHPELVLFVAIHLQRIYREVLKQGFEFDRGMRIAINYGRYRLIPIQGENPGEELYEFFGQGIVELSRLTTGKKSRELEELQHLLVSRGYAEAEVARFFAPLAGRGVDLVDRRQAGRPFYAYVNQNGTLINEGIVATGPFLSRLAEEVETGPLSLASLEGSVFVAFEIEVGPDRVRVGARKLGLASLKGLEEIPIYEIVDGEELVSAGTVEETELLAAVERQFALEHTGSVA